MFSIQTNTPVSSSDSCNKCNKRGLVAYIETFIFKGRRLWICIPKRETCTLWGWYEWCEIWDYRFFMLHYYVCYTILRETTSPPPPLFPTKPNKYIISNVVRHENYRGILVVPCSLWALRSCRPKTEGLESSVPKCCVPQIIFEGLSSGLCFTSVHSTGFLWAATMSVVITWLQVSHPEVKQQ